MVDRQLIEKPAATTMPMPLARVAIEIDSGYQSSIVGVRTHHAQ
jgi:hypothetical protein